MATRIELLTCIATAAGLTAAAAAGPDWPELGDAGPTPDTAQIIPPLGELKSIRGALMGTLLEGAPDFEDMYLIYIEDPASFEIKTVSKSYIICDDELVPIDGSTFNTQVWLFKADPPVDAGKGLLCNDDDPADPPRSRLLPNSTDSSGAALTTPGYYYLAYSGGPSRNPISASGLIFNKAVATEISGPDGPGGTLPILAWSGPPVVGMYESKMCGVESQDEKNPPPDPPKPPPPPPGIPTVSEWGLIAMAGLLLAGGAALILRRGRMAVAA